jgi:hypothetical protein
MEEVDNEDAGAAASPSPAPNVGTPVASSTGAHTPVAMTPGAPAATPAPPVFVTPPSDADEYLDSDNDDVTPTFRIVDDVLGPATPPELAPRNLDAELYLQVGEEPRSFAEAEGDASWQKAMEEEMNSIMANKMWRLEALLAGHRAIGLNWVYKLKKNSAGEVVKHKARLVTKGYVQQQGVDFEEVFAPMARIESVRLLLALAAQEGWPVHHMDVKSAFLNGELQEEVYVRQPPSFVVKGQEDKVLRLHKQGRSQEFVQISNF